MTETNVSNESLPRIPKVGDVVARMFCGAPAMLLKVTAVTDRIVSCGGWEFCSKTGAEIDDLLGWGPRPLRTGSFLQADRDGSIRVFTPAESTKRFPTR
jgi:hypothetical protein